MLEYDRIDTCERIYINETNASKEYAIIGIMPNMTFLVFLDTNFNYEPYLCNVFHNLIQKAMNFNDFAIVSIKGNGYRIYFWYMSKYDTINEALYIKDQYNHDLHKQ